MAFFFPPIFFVVAQRLITFQQLSSSTRDNRDNLAPKLSGAPQNSNSAAAALTRAPGALQGSLEALEALQKQNKELEREIHVLTSESLQERSNILLLALLLLLYYLPDQVLTSESLQERSNIQVLGLQAEAGARLAEKAEEADASLREHEGAADGAATAAAGAVLRKVQQQMERLEAASQSVAQRVRDAEKELLFLNKHARETAAASDATHADLEAVRADTFALAQELQSAERALVQVTEATEQRQQAQVANEHARTTVSSDLRKQVLSIVEEMQRLEEEKKTLEASRSNSPPHTHGASAKQQLVRLLCVYVCVIYIYI
jgi:uncharacterized protein (UPF0335 family)